MRTMLLKLRPLGVAAVLAILPLVTVAAQDAVVKRNVNLRQDPSTANPPIRLLLPRDEISLLEPNRTNRYYHVVTADGVEGWVWGNNIRVVFPPDGPVEVYNGCSMEGSAKSARGQAVNQLKNRYTAPAAADINAAITLAAILQPGDDENRWQESNGATITGYVVKAFRGSVETVNCGAKATVHRDTHIEVALDANNTAKNQRFIVEVTPKWRAYMGQLGQDWASATLSSTLTDDCAEFTGWMFWDSYHDDEAENTTPGRSGNWRATAWEIHPVTAIRVVPCP